MFGVKCNITSRPMNGYEQDRHCSIGFRYMFRISHRFMICTSVYDVRGSIMFKCYK